MRLRHALPLAPVLLLAACSGGDPGGSAAPATTTSTAAATTTTVSKAAFLEQANAICKDMNRRSGEITSSFPGGRPSGPTEQASLLEQNADLLESNIAELEALAVPSGEEQALETMWADVRRLAGYSRQLAAAVRAGDRAHFDQIAAEGQALQTKANADATAYGLVECGRGG